MNRRRKDIKKLIEYARLIGIRIRFEDIEDYGLYIFKEGNSKPYIIIGTEDVCETEKLFTILHELGHHIDFIKGGWSKQDFKALVKFSSQGSRAPKWAKNRIKERESKADKYGKGIAEVLDIKLPEFLYKYDLAKTRFYLQELCKRDKIPDYDWSVMKRKIRERI